MQKIAHKLTEFRRISNNFFDIKYGKCQNKLPR